MSNFEAATAAIRKVAESFSETWNRHDMDAFGRLFTDDAEFVNVVGMWWRGRPQIQGAHAHTHATFFKNSTLSGDIASLKFLAPDVALVHIAWHLVGHLEPQGNVGEPRDGILVLTIVETGNGWRIAAAQNTNEVPEARARMAVNG